MTNKKIIEDECRFIRDFILQEMYLQNPPMAAEEFISFCEKLGVYTSEEELEYFEREKLLFPIIRIERPVEENEKILFRGADGMKYCRPVEYGLKEEETEIERYKEKAYSNYNVFKEDRIGTSFYKELLLSWLESGNLFDPRTRGFQSWSAFWGEELDYDSQRVVSFYSNFQIWHLVNLCRMTSARFSHEKTKFIVDDQAVFFEEGKVYLEFKARVELYNEEEAAQLDRPIKSNKEIKAVVERFSMSLDLKAIKDNWFRHNDNFLKILKFLLSVQSVYYPYAKSGSGKIQITGDWEKWSEKRHNLKIDEILAYLDLKIEEISEWYKIFSGKAQKLLGIERDDWIQLLKSISWDKKDKLEGNTRLGVEYLQWAVMFKRILEENLQREILDIDEMTNIAQGDVLKFEPDHMNQFGFLRTTRNNKYSDQDKNYYYDRHKRMFYLANDFGLDYQPRITIFVEGKTEEKVFPEIFEKVAGNKPENVGIEFLSINGISQFFGSETSLKNTQGNYDRKFISNFNHLASYNLNKWQIIPFFIGDDENNIRHLLQRGLAISFDQKHYSYPSDWQYIWGLTNKNVPFQGKDFEMANFNNDEIAAVLSSILVQEIKPSDVQAKRENGQGIKYIGNDVEKHKVDIAGKLIKNLYDEYEKKLDDSLLQRPIFQVIRKIRELANLNHPPVNRAIQLKNKEFIEGELQKGTP